MRCTSRLEGRDEKKRKTGDFLGDPERTSALLKDGGYKGETARQLC